MAPQRTISIAGENALIVYFGDTPSEAIAAEIAATASQLRIILDDTLVDLVPSYASLLVIYDPFKT
ncbi:carboxyltransferase domain-containing protein, partial [Porticoccaceae bacterium]|nr:carboxyltransferase domain-containing protein [Porticoccaceae bacterium]